MYDFQCVINVQDSIVIYVFSKFTNKKTFIFIVIRGEKLFLLLYCYNLVFKQKELFIFQNICLKRRCTISTVTHCITL